MAEIPEKPNTNLEQYLNRIATGGGEIPDEPRTNVEQYLNYIIEHGSGGGGEIVTELPEIGEEGRLYILADSATEPTKAYGVYTYMDGWVLVAQPIDQSVQLVDTLPQEGQEGVLYYVPKAGSSDTYDLYRWLNDTWVKVDTDVVLYSSTGQNTDGAMTQKATTDALSGKQDTLTFDQTPTTASNNPVTSAGIKSAIDEAQGKPTELTSEDYDWPTTGTATSVALWKLDNGTYTAAKGTSVSPISSTPYDGGLIFVQQPTAQKPGRIVIFSDTGETYFSGVSTSGTAESQGNIVTTVVNNLTSTSAKDALSAKQGKELQDTKQDKLTFDNTPTQDSTNPVTSGGIKAYVDAAAVTFKPFPDEVETDGTTQAFLNSILALDPPVGMAYLGTVSLTDMPAGLLQEEVEVYVYSDYVIYARMKSTDVAPYEWWCASYNYQGWQPVNTDTTYTAGTNVQISNQNVISATDTTYSDFTGTDGTAAGTAGLVPAPTAADAGKVLKADGTWGSAGSSINVVQTTGTSTSDVMSQNATTSMIYATPATESNIRIGHNAHAINNTISLGGSAGGNNLATNCIFVGHGAHSSELSYGTNHLLTGGIGLGMSTYLEGDGAMALGNEAIGWRIGSIALGAYSEANSPGEMNIGTSDTDYGYQNSNYRLISGVYDGQNAHDVATKGQLDAIVNKNAGAPTSTTEGTVGQLLTDTTNGKLYICTGVTPGTDPDPDTYTWEEVGSEFVDPIDSQDWEGLWQ